MARSFNGTTDGIDLSNPTSLAALYSINTITLSVWVYGTSATTDGFIWGVNATGVEIIMVRWDRSGSGTIDGVVFNSTSLGPGSLIHSTTTTAAATNHWTHVALSWDGISNRIWINGINENTNAYAGTALFGAAGVHHWEVGRDFANSANTFAGNISDPAVWNVTLTGAEILALAKGARSGSIRPAAVVAWLPIDGLQSPEPDLSGNANNGTLTGTALAPGPPVMMFTPRWPQTTPGGAAASSVVYRSTLSSLGTRTGSRQVQGAA